MTKNTIIYISYNLGLRHKDTQLDTRVPQNKLPHLNIAPLKATNQRFASVDR